MMEPKQSMEMTTSGITPHEGHRRKDHDEGEVPWKRRAIVHAKIVWWRPYISILPYVPPVVYHQLFNLPLGAPHLSVSSLG